jgi:hypothetical protein
MPVVYRYRPAAPVACGTAVRPVSVYRYANDSLGIIPSGQPVEFLDDRALAPCRAGCRSAVALAEACVSPRVLRTRPAAVRIDASAQLGAGTGARAERGELIVGYLAGHLPVLPCGDPIQVGLNQALDAEPIRTGTSCSTSLPDTFAKPFDLFVVGARELLLQQLGVGSRAAAGVVSRCAACKPSSAGRIGARPNGAWSGGCMLLLLVVHPGAGHTIPAAYGTSCSSRLSVTMRSLSPVRVTSTRPMPTRTSSLSSTTFAAILSWRAR